MTKTKQRTTKLCAYSMRYTVIIQGYFLSIHPANEKWHYIVTSSLIGWADLQKWSLIIWLLLIAIQCHGTYWHISTPINLIHFISVHLSAVAQWHYSKMSIAYCDAIRFNETGQYIVYIPNSAVPVQCCAENRQFFSGHYENYVRCNKSSEYHHLLTLFSATYPR